MQKQIWLRFSFQLDFKLHFWSQPPPEFVENGADESGWTEWNSEVTGQDDDSTPFTYM